jgi:putative modified peptide
MRGERNVSDAVLTNEQALKLLTELATNGGFRQRYSEKPAAALLEIGVPATTIANLPAACLAPCKLDTSQARMDETREILRKSSAETAQSMAIPTVRLR